MCLPQNKSAVNGGGVNKPSAQGFEAFDRLPLEQIVLLIIELENSTKPNTPDKLASVKFAPSTVPSGNSEKDGIRQISPS